MVSAVNWLFDCFLLLFNLHVVFLLFFVVFLFLECQVVILVEILRSYEAAIKGLSLTLVWQPHRTSEFLHGIRAKGGLDLLILEHFLGSLEKFFISDLLVVLDSKFSVQNSG
jgi:hypothetical protein